MNRFPLWTAEAGSLWARLGGSVNTGGGPGESFRPLFFLFFFWPHPSRNAKVSGPQPGMGPAAPAVETWSPNYWTTREVLNFLMKSRRKEGEEERGGKKEEKQENEGEEEEEVGTPGSLGTHSLEAIPTQTLISENL